MINEIAFYLICAAWIIFACWYDWKEIKSGFRPQHALESSWQFLFIGVVSIMLFYGTWQHIVSHILWYVIIRIVFYSPVLNLFRNETLSYIGEDKSTSSLEDRFYHMVNRITGSKLNYTSLWQWVIKALLCVSIYLFIKLVINHGS
jgi:hypothetical protein